MALDTSDKLVAALAGAQRVGIFKSAVTGEAAGVWHSYLFVAGFPGAGSAPSPGINGEAVSNSISGFLPYTNAAGGNQKYLASMEASGNVAGNIILVDMLWWNSGVNVTTTTAQTLSAVAIPSRDVNGSANGAGIEAGILVSTATTNASAVTNTTFTYTNSAGTTGKSGSIGSFPATCVAGSIIPFALAAGDVGVRAIESVTLGTSYGGGAIHLVLFRRIAQIPIPFSGSGGSRNFFDIGSKLYNGSALFIMNNASGTSSPSVTASIAMIEG